MLYNLFHGTDVISHRITSHQIKLCRIILCVTTPHRTTSHRTTLHHITPHHIAPHHITPHHITLHNITSHHITSHHIVPHHITPHHTTSHYTNQLNHVNFELNQMKSPVMSGNVHGLSTSNSESIGPGSTSLISQLSELFNAISAVCAEQFMLIRKIFPPNVVAR